MKNYWWLFVIITVASLLLSYGLYLLKPVTAAINFQDFRLEPGVGFSEIAVALENRGLIRSSFAFKIYSLFTGVAARLKAGDYWISPSQSTPRIIADLVRGPATDQPVVVVEGATLQEIDEQLAAAGILRRGALLKFDWQTLSDDYEFLTDAKSLQGFLFPDTYRFFPKSSTEAVIRKFLDNFQKKAWPLISKCRASNIKCKTLNDKETLTLASIIEKEVPFAHDRRLVSGILRKRLAIGMPLQVDAAPDTYKYYGLPPAPIANPGLDAIEAALNPKFSPYLYYLSDPKTKKTIFSQTLDEHNENKHIYLGL